MYRSIIKHPYPNQNPDIINQIFQNKIRGKEKDFYKLGLSIDGGGMRGIIPASIMNLIC